MTLGVGVMMTLGVGCSDEEGSGSTVTTGSDASVSGSSPGSESDGSGGSGVSVTVVDVSTTGRANAPTTVVAVTTVVAASTTVPTSAPDPFASSPPPDPTEPDPTEPDDMPGPPADDCVDAPADVATVEVSFDDDRIVYDGATAPSCVRVHAGQRIVLRSTSGAASTVVAGADVYEIPAGSAVTTPALGSLFGVGEVFDVYVEHLDTTVVVQVLP
jgi:hypothetical protein